MYYVIKHPEVSNNLNFINTKFEVLHVAIVNNKPKVSYKTILNKGEVITKSCKITLPKYLNRAVLIYHTDHSGLGTYKFSSVHPTLEDALAAKAKLVKQVNTVAKSLVEKYTKAYNKEINLNSKEINTVTNMYPDQFI